MIDTKLLRQKILDLAIRGKLVPQAPSDEPASELLKRINAEKAVLVKSGKIKKEKPLPPISKDEIPFDIPESWTWVRLKKLLNQASTGPFGSMLHKADYVVDGIPLVNPANMVNSSISEIGIKRVSKATAERLKAYKLSTKDVVIGRRGEMGRSAVVTDKEKGWLCGTGCFFVTPNKALLAEYLVLFLASTWIRNKLLEKSIGSTMNNLNHGILGDLPVPLPPIMEQKKILAAVEALMNEVDTIERETENLNRTFALTREKALDLAIRGKLVPQDPTDEPASELLKRIKAEKSALIKSGKLKKEKPLPPITKDEIPFPIPASWSWVRLASLGTVVGGGTPSTSVPEYWDGAIPWLSPCDLSDYDGKYIGHGKRNISQEGLDHSSAALMPAGSILYSSRAPIGYVVIASNEISTNQGFKSLVPAIDGINEFIYYALKALTSDIKNRATGTTFKEISGSEFGKTLIPLPPLAEQKRIVKKLETIFSTLNIQV